MFRSDVSEKYSLKYNVICLKYKKSTFEERYKCTAPKRLFIYSFHSNVVCLHVISAYYSVVYANLHGGIFVIKAGH